MMPGRKIYFCTKENVLFETGFRTDTDVKEILCVM